VSETAALELRGIARRFGRRWVLRGIEFNAAGGQVIAITGRNGSGKTTLLRILATLLRPTRGAGQVFGLDLLRDADSIRVRVGFLAHETGLYGTLTAEENLVFAQRMAGAPADGRRIAAALDEAGLAGERRERVRGFSSGMRRRLALARLLLRPPRLLLYDEPYASFDADGVTRVNRLALDVAGSGGIVLLATHDLSRAEPILHRRAAIEDGRILERGSPADEVTATDEAI